RDGVVHRQDVVAVNGLAGDAIARRAGRDRAARRRERLGGGRGPAVVFADEDDGKPPECGQVHAFVERPAVRGSVTEERDHHLPRLPVSDREPHARREDAAGGQDAVGAEVPDRDVGDVHRAALAVADPVGLTVELRHEAAERAALGDEVAVAAVRGEKVVVGSERRAHADGNSLLAHGGVEESRNAPAGEELTHALLEEPHAEHPGVHREQPVGSGRHCKGVREVGAIGGWPETRRDPAPVLSALFIPPGVREVGAIGGWPETRRDPAAVLSALFIPPGVREVGAIGGWPETRRDPAPVLSALFIPPGVREVGAIGGWPETRRDPAPVLSALFIPPGVREVGAMGGWPETRRNPAPVVSALFMPPGVREVGAIGGWAGTRRDPAPVLSALFIPPGVREVGAIGGWPETRRDPAPVLSALFIPPGVRATGTLRGWPDKGTTRLRYARA